MIVRTPADGSLIMIAQTVHAELSGMFAARWGNATFARPQPYQPVVRAAIYHDAGWYRYEARPTYDVATRSTPGFAQVPADQTQLAAYQWAIDWLTDIDNFAGLLISRHRTGLWRERYGTIRHPPLHAPRAPGDLVTAFVDRNEAGQERALAELDRNVFSTNYHLLQVWDLLSLYLCMADPPQNQYLDPVPTGYKPADREGLCLSLIPRESDRIEITPYPFDVHPLPVQHIYKQLETRDFATEDAFLEAYYAAVPRSQQFEFV
jgi:hypothetical protein